MSLTASEIIQVIEKAKELGAKEVTVEGCNVSFGLDELKSEESNTVTIPQFTDEELAKPLQYFDEILSDPELVLYAATPHFDELLAEKQAKQKLREESMKERAND